jgi:NhaA family Na+:H+ antiporter
MATDIAFVVGCMAVLGSRVPAGLRVLLLSLAIADDIGAILVIAIGYTDVIQLGWLLLGFAGVVVVWALERIGVRAVPVYILVGAVVWLGFHESGVHATIAGVILGLLTPAHSWLGGWRLRLIGERVDRYLHGDRPTTPAGERDALREMEIASRETISPLVRLESRLHPWQAFAIVPLFALCNAGVPFKVEGLTDPIAHAVIAGLVLGKPLGILGFAFLAVRLGWASLPEGVTWGAVTGGGLLAGIGFTMALFIAELALPGDALYAAKVGILTASFGAAALGMVVLTRVLPAREG